MTFGAATDQIEELLDQARHLTTAQVAAIGNATWYTTIRSSGRGDTGAHATEWSLRWDDMSHWMRWPGDDLADEDYQELPILATEVEEAARQALLVSPAFERRRERTPRFRTVHSYVTDIARSWIYEDYISATQQRDLFSVWLTVVIAGRTEAYGDPLKEAYNKASCLTTSIGLVTLLGWLIVILA